MDPRLSPPAAYIQQILDRLDEARPTARGWRSKCPCPGHGGDGDHHPSLDISIGEDGRILLICRVGCLTDEILEASNLDWSDLFPRTGDVPADTMISPQAPGSEVTGNGEVMDRGYQALLGSLKLGKAHHEDLKRRGLPEGTIDQGGYRSLRNTDRGRVARSVVTELGDAAFSVPGVVEGPHGPTIEGTATGLLIPVRGIDGQINAIKVRQAREPRYLYISSTGGPSSGSPPHVPLAVTGPAPVVRVTEGELKADVATAIGELPTIGVAGVGQWRTSLPLLRELEAETVVIAFDAPDVLTKAPVFEQARTFWQGLEETDYQVEMEIWNDET